jgi:hypothetical protein
MESSCHKEYSCKISKLYYIPLAEVRRTERQIHTHHINNVLPFWIGDLGGIFKITQDFLVQLAVLWGGSSYMKEIKILPHIGDFFINLIGQFRAFLSEVFSIHPSDDTVSLEGLLLMVPEDLILLRI